MQLFFVSALLIAVSVPGFVAAQAAPAIDRLEAVMADLKYLSSEECEGRGLRTKGLEKAADYIATAFKNAGLKPAFPENSYFQPFVTRESFLEEGTQVASFQVGPKIIAGEFRTSFTVCGLSGKGAVTADLVFAGYGISAKSYDDYAGLDVAGKIVVVLRQAPKPAAKDKKILGDDEAPSVSSLKAKIDRASKAKVAGIILLNDIEMAGKEDPLMPYDYANEAPPSPNLPIVHLKRQMIDELLAGQGTSLAKIEEGIGAGGKPNSFAIENCKASLTAAVGIRELKIKNIVGSLEGSGPLANETIVIGAHYDHLGRGEKGSKVLGSSEIHYGADDNGSGSSGLLELARRYGAMKNRQGRRLVFIAFTGEEKGLLGSMHYCDKPAFPLKDTVAMFNMDMIGRLRPDEKTKKDTMTVGGVGSAKNFEKLLDDTNKNFDFKIDKSMSGTGPSDHTSFYLAKVPVYFFFTGEHPEYHTPKDQAATINYAGLIKIVNMVETMVNQVSATATRPEYVPGMGGSQSASMMNMPKIGLMPAYDDAATTGMGVGGVIPGRPAEKGGVKKGDTITVIDGKPVKNVQDYMKVMATLKRGNPVELTVIRDGKEVKLKVTPE
jgi:Peptidase family M28/PDZ domain/PA domain